MGHIRDDCKAKARVDNGELCKDRPPRAVNHVEEDVDTGHFDADINNFECGVCNAEADEDEDEYQEHSEEDLDLNDPFFQPGQDPWRGVTSRDYHGEEDSESEDGSNGDGESCRSIT